jgi:hypothetical protein
VALDEYTLGAFISDGPNVEDMIKLVGVGDKVYFDSWLAAKYPKEGTDDFYWLVKWDDVRAVEHPQDALPE